MSFLATLYLVVALLLLGTLAARSVAARHREVISLTFGSAVRLVAGLGLFALILYATAYFLGLVGGFYESLTCKVVTLPSCEDPLALPAWLALPEASVGGIIGILPLLGIFLAKALQPRSAAEKARDEEVASAERDVAQGRAGVFGAARGADDPTRTLGTNYFVFEREGGLVSVLSTDKLPPGLQPQHLLEKARAPKPLRERIVTGASAWLAANAALIGIFLVEMWLAWLRGAAEAADRQVRLSLGLDADLPAAYLGVAQWGAVVLALGLSVVVLFLGVIARYGIKVAGRGFDGLRQGAGIIDLIGSSLSVFASGLRQGWIVSAITIGRTALKLQSGLTRFYVMAVTAIGRALLKFQSGAQSAWAFMSILVGTYVLFLSRVFGRLFAWIGTWGRRRPRTPGLGPDGNGAAHEPAAGRRGGGVLAIALASAIATGAHQAHATTTYVVLQDASGGEESRLEDANRKVLSWADPSPQLALLERSDRLIVIPVRAPGELDTVYAALFNAEYPGSQLDRYAFYAELRNVLPKQVDEKWGTGLSEALRTAALYLRDAPPDHEKVLIVFGNGEDHSPDPVTAEDLGSALEGAIVVRLNAGLEELDRWTELYDAAGAEAQIVYDQAATRLLTVTELSAALQRATDQR